MKYTIFYAVTMMYWFALYMYVPILGPYVQHLGGSLQVVGLVIGSYGFTQMLLRIPLGLASDRLRRRREFITLGMVLAFASSLGMGMVDNPWAVLVFRGLSGGAAATWVTFTVLFSSYFTPQEAPKAMGVIVFYTYIGQMVATTLGGFAADLLGWQAPFVIGGLVGIIGVIASLRIEEPRDIQSEAVEVKELLSVARDRTLIAVSFLAIIFQCLMFSTVYGFTPMHAVNIGASKSALSILALISALPAAFSALHSGAWAKRFGEQRLLVLAFFAIALFTLTIPFTTNMPLLYITQGLGGVGRGVVFPVLMGLSIKSVSNEKRATAMGFFQSIYALGMFGGPVLVGFISDYLTLTGGFVIVSLMGFAATWLTYKLLADARDTTVVLRKGF